MKSIPAFFAMLLVSAAVFAADFEQGLCDGAGLGDGGRTWLVPPPEDAPDGRWRIFGGTLDVGVGGEIKRMPYKNYDLDWMVGPVVDFESDYLYVRNLEVGGKLINLKGDGERPIFMAAIYTAYDRFQFDPDDTDDPLLKRLDKRRGSLYAGINLEWLTPIGLFEAKAGRDLLGHSDGLQGRVAYTVQFDAGPVSFYPRVGFNWADSRYNEYYYGVGRGESRKSGVSDYAPAGSLTPFVGLAATLPLPKHWELAASSEVAFLPNTIRDSPMTDQNATYTFGVRLGFSF